MKAMLVKELDYTLFDTPIGTCAIGWSRNGVTCLRFPEANDKDMAGNFGEEYRKVENQIAPSWIKNTIEKVRLLLTTGNADLTTIPLDMSEVPEFHKKVYIEARRIAPGNVTSYSDLATRCGSGGAARAVGQALARNPFALIVPCHRILAKNGNPGGFSASRGVALKIKLLEKEGISIWDNVKSFMKKQNRKRD